MTPLIKSRNPLSKITGVELINFLDELPVIF